MKHVTFGLAVLLSVAAVAGASSKYDFTGHWTGSVTDKSGTPLALTADLTGAKSFTGTAAIASQPALSCSVNGTQSGKGKVVVHLKCDDGGKLSVRGRLDTTAGTMSGTYALTRPKKHLKHGAFVLTKQP